MAGYGDSLATSAFLSPDDRAGRASASKRGALAWDSRAMEEEYLGKDSTARDLYGMGDDDKEGYKPFVPAAGGDMSPVAQTTKRFGDLQGVEARKLPEGKLKSEELNPQATQNTGKDEEVFLFHYGGPESGICSGRIATGLRVCVTSRLI